MLRHLIGSRQLDGKKFRNSGLLLATIFTLIFSLAPLARAQDDGHDSNARIVRLSYVDGDVRLDNGRGYESATMNVPLAEHSWLQTGSDGWAEVQMEDGSIIRLAPDTVITFSELGHSASGGTITTVDLDQGEVEFKIAKPGDSDFQVTVKKNTIALNRAGTFRVSSTNSDPLEVAVWKGEIGVRDAENGGEVAVQKNETFVLNPDDPGQYALDKSADVDDLDQWSKQRDDALSTYASGNRGDAGSPYQYGSTDLDYYGQYFDAPGYGQVWQPNNVGYNWDPFSNGYWSYSPGFGYTWVSSYPWGWMPYRYGRWVFINGRGWAWAPGGWSRWNRTPLIVNAPPGFHAPIPPVNTRIVGRTPGQIIRPGEPVRNEGPGGRFAGSDRNRADVDNRNPGHEEVNNGNHHVFTNDDVARIPRTDVPAHPPVPATTDVERKPRVTQQESESGPENRGEFNRDRGNRDQAQQPVRRSNSDGVANRVSESQPERQYTPPPQSYSPPNRQAERQNTPPPQSYSPPNRQADRPSAPPPPRQESAPVMHQSAPAPAPRQSSPPSESHSRSEEGSSRGHR